jgi:uncharacterized membrane protein YbhN (UPF0104 family)
VNKKWRVAASAALLTVLAWRMDWARAAAAFADLQWSLWLLALGLYLSLQAVSSLRWRLLAGPLGLGGSARQYLAYYYVGMFFNLVLPTSVGGDVVRAWYLARRSGPEPPLGRGPAAALSVFLDRLSGVLVLAALACVAAVCCPVPLPAWVASSVAGVGGAVVLGLAGLPLAARLLALPRRSWSPKLEAALGRIRQLVEGSLTCLCHRRTAFAAAGLAAVVQVGNVVLVGLVGEALRLPVPPLYYGVVVPLVTLLTLLPVSVNGMGVREAGTALLLAPVGVGTAEAVTLAFLTFAVYATASAAGVGFYLSERSAFRAPRSGPLEVRSDDDAVGGDSDQGRARQPPAAA